MKTKFFIIVSLDCWEEVFALVNVPEQRKCTFEFKHAKLLFISQREMNYCLKGRELLLGLKVQILFISLVVKLCMISFIDYTEVGMASSFR